MNHFQFAKQISKVTTTALSLLFFLPSPGITQTYVKPEIRGIISMGQANFVNGLPNNSIDDFYNVPGVFSGVVINVGWDQLNPAPGVFTLGVLTSYLDPVRKYNSTYPKTPLHVRLRVVGSDYTPAWVKNLGSGPVQILHRGNPITVGPFWSKDYVSAWTALQNALAQRFDKDPIISDVTNTLGSQSTDEPFNLADDPLSSHNLHQAGFSDSAYESVLAHAASSYTAWQSTHIEYPFSPYKEIDSGKVVVKDAVTRKIMTEWRQQLGARGMLSNQALNYPPAEALKFIYFDIHKLGSPITFQTHAPGSLDWKFVIQYGVRLGAHSIELWSGPGNRGWQHFDKAQLEKWADELEKN